MASDSRAAEVAADSLGYDLLQALVDEVSQFPGWQGLTQAQQDTHINRLGANVRRLVKGTLDILFGANYPACSAIIGDVIFSTGSIKAKLQIDRTAVSRHELSDAAGQQVVIVMANPDQWFERMESIKGALDQRDLFHHAREPLGHMGQEEKPAPEDKPQSSAASPDSEGSALGDMLPASDEIPAVLIPGQVLEALKDAGAMLREDAGSLADGLSQDELRDVMVWTIAARSALEAGREVPPPPPILASLVVTASGTQQEVIDALAASTPPPEAAPPAPESPPLESDTEIIVRELKARGIKVTDKSVKRWSRSQRVAVHSWLTGLAQDPPDFLPKPDSPVPGKEDTP